MTMLDVLGPHQALGMTPGIEVFTFARIKDPLVTDSDLTIVPDHDFSDLPACDVLLVGGGGNPYPEIQIPEVIETLARVGGQAKYVTSVCTGGLFLAEAGLLNGYRANTHWAAREILDTYPGVEVADGRVVVDRNRHRVLHPADHGVQPGTAVHHRPPRHVTSRTGREGACPVCPDGTGPLREGKGGRPACLSGISPPPVTNQAAAGRRFEGHLFTEQRSADGA